MTRRNWLASAASAAAQSPARKPNIVLPLADDMGWGAPNIDASAASGARFENFYSASAVCSPSCAAILTGPYPLRFDIRKTFSGYEADLPVGVLPATVLGASPSQRFAIGTAVRCAPVG